MLLVGRRKWCKGCHRLKMDKALIERLCRRLHRHEGTSSNTPSFMRKTFEMRVISASVNRGPKLLQQLAHFVQSISLKTSV